MGRNQNRMANHLDYINFDSLTQLTILNLKNHLRLYETILDILMNTNYKKLTDLIPIEKLKLEFQNIQRQASEENCMIPINLDYLNMAQLLLISTISTKRMGNHLMIKITIPTVYQSEFDLLEAIPISSEYQNATYEIIPIAQFCLIYIDKTEEFQNVYYSPLNLQDKTRCITLAEGISLCYPDKAMQVTQFNTTLEFKPSHYFFLPDLEACDVRNRNFYEHMNHNSNYCNVRRVRHTNQKPLYITPVNQCSYRIYIRTVQLKWTKAIHSKGATHLLIELVELHECLQHIR